MGPDRFEEAMAMVRVVLEEVRPLPSRAKSVVQTKLDEALLWYYAARDPEILQK